MSRKHQSGIVAIAFSPNDKVIARGAFLYLLISEVDRLDSDSCS
jgi:hypothetical protein